MRSASVSIGGCTSWLATRQSFEALLAVTNGGGFATAPLAVPSDTVLRGRPVFAQWFVLDPQGSALGLAFSAGRSLVPGD